jgi:hypothetical protein
MVICLVTIGYLFWQNQQLMIRLASKNETNTTAYIDSIIPTPNLKATPGPVANIKTYVDPAGKFSFSYPDTYTILTAVPKSFNGTMLDLVRDHCGTPVLQNSVNPNVLILFQIRPVGSDGGYCWSNGIFSEDNKWRSSDPASSWKGDYFEMKSVVARSTYLVATVGLANKGTYQIVGEDVLNQIATSFKFIGNQSLKPADGQTPAAGICADDNNPIVNIDINPDTANPRCVKVASQQKLQITNNWGEPIEVKLAQYDVTILPGKKQVVGEVFGSYLGKGVHRVNIFSAPSPEIWLQ